MSIRIHSLNTVPVGGTLFEQDWQSLICPDGADSEVRGLYILNLN